MAKFTCMYYTCVCSVLLKGLAKARVLNTNHRIVLIGLVHVGLRFFGLTHMYVYHQPGYVYLQQKYNVSIVLSLYKYVNTQKP